MRLIILLITLAALLTLAACGGAPMASQAMPEPAAATATDAETASGGPAALEESRVDGAAEPAQQPASQRLVIKNATISIEVEQVADAETRIRARAEQLGGYVVSVATSGSGAYLSSQIIFRVPADRFEAALSGVEGLARDVLSRSVSGDDVTEEFVDLESRLRNLEATRDRLLDLLARATKVEDALQVNQALTEVQGEIEQITGRMNYLRQSAAFSTITADLQPVPPPPTIIEEDQWQPLRVAGEALRELIVFGQGLLNLAIVLAVWTPLWLPLLLAARWGWHRLRRNTTRRTPPVEPGLPGV